MSQQPSPLNQESPWNGVLSDVRPLLRFVRRWWMLAIIMIVLSSVATLGYAIFQGVRYEVSALLLYQLGPELSPPPTMTREQMVITRRAEDVNDEIEILGSPDLVRDVVRELGEPFFTPPPPTTTIGKLKLSVKNGIKSVTSQIEDITILLGLRKRLEFLEKVELSLAESLKIELVRESDVIAVTLESPDPEAGELILQRILDTYQERHLAVHQEVAIKDFFFEQVQQLRERLQESRSKILAFQEINDLWSATDQQKLLLDNRKSSQMQVAFTRAQVANLESLVRQLASSINELPEVIELTSSEQTNPARVSLQDRLASLAMNSALVNATYRNGTIERDSQQSQSQAMELELGDRPPLIPYIRTEGINQVRQDIVKEHAVKSAELDGLKSQLSVEQTQLEQFDEQLRTLGAAIAKFQHLEREHGLLEEKYALYVDNYEKADVASVMNLAQISNVELISPPTATLQPAKPRLKLLAGVSVAAGLAMAFLIAVVFELRAALKSTSLTT